MKLDPNTLVKQVSKTLNSRSNLRIALICGFFLTLLLLGTRQGTALQHWAFKDNTPHASEVASLVGRYLRDTRGSNDIRLDQYNYNMNDELDKIQKGDQVPTSEYLAHFLQVPVKEMKQLEGEHYRAVKALPKHFSDYFKGDGVVFLAGGRYFPAFLVALRQLRQHNPTVPVEVFFQTWEEYEPDYCENVFPNMNIQCRILEQMYGQTARNLNGFSAKVLAMASSSFENVFYSDPEAYVLSDPAAIFKKSPYKDVGLITFPDFWARTESPFYYAIAGIPLGPRVRGSSVWVVNDGKVHDVIAQSDHKNAIHSRSTDAAQLYVSKSLHFRTLLLALYYTMHDQAYYPLLLQGAPGFGGKEVFAAAATVLGADFYQVLHPVEGAGYWDDGGFHLHGMMHYDPVQDYRHMGARSSARSPEFFSVHANELRLNARVLFTAFEDNNLNWPKLGKHRYFGKLSDMRRKIDHDFELELFTHMKWVACDLAWTGNHVMNDWKGENLERLCKFTMDHAEWLKYNQESS